ncbi:hypothetical protein [Rhodococcus sp. NPDC003348]
MIEPTETDVVGEAPNAAAGAVDEVTFAVDRTGTGESSPGTPDAGTVPVDEAGSVDSTTGGTAVAASVPETPVQETAAPGRPVNRTSALRPRQRSAEDVEVEDAADPAAERRGWRRVAVIGVAALALAAFALLAAFRPGADVSNRAWVDTSATTQVAAAARGAIQTLYTYKFDTVDQDFDNARAVLTDSMRTEFDQTAQVTRDAVIQTKTATEAQVTDIGVKLLSDDRAELVASMNVSASNDGVAQGSAAGPLSVTMSKVGDIWLLSDIRDR